MIFNVVLIGAGQLGSRHLQGLKQASAEMRIYVIDPSLESLELARKRCKEINQRTYKEISYSTEYTGLPDIVDLAIIATSSLPRYDMTRTLCDKCVVKNIVFEKFLFPDITQYDEVYNLLTNKNITAYVNCPRRMYDSYKSLKGMIDTKSPITMKYCASNWGMCCNSIHFIDLFMYLVEGESYNIDFSGVEKKLYESKRIGYIELMGVENIKYKNSILELSCVSENITSSGIEIQNGNNLFVINESNRSIKINEEFSSFNVYFQSQLSSVLADELLLHKKCDLPLYSVSSVFHKLYLQEVLEIYCKIINMNVKSCPIT